MGGGVEGHTRDYATRWRPDMPKVSTDRECWLKVTLKGMPMGWVGLDSPEFVPLPDTEAGIKPCPPNYRNVSHNGIRVSQVVHKWTG